MSRGRLQVWDPYTGVGRRICGPVTTEHGSYFFSCQSMEFLPNSDSLALAMSKTVQLWDIQTEECKKTLKGHSDAVMSVTCSPDGKSLESTSFDGTVKVWNLGTCKRTEDYHDKHNLPSCAMALSHDGQLALVGSRGRGAYPYDVSTGTDMPTINAGRHVKSVAISPDGKQLAVAIRDVELWDTATGTLQKSIKSRVYGNELSFSPDGNYLKTSQGSYKLTSGVLAESPDPELSQSTLYVDGDGEWVVRGDKKLLWIPPDYRGQSTAVGQNTIVPGSVSGQVLFLDLN